MKFFIPINSEINLVLMDGALHHMTEIKEVFIYLKKIINKDTVFLAREPQNGNVFFQLLRKIRMKIDNSYSNNQVFFSETQLLNIMEKCEMKEITFKYQGLLSPPFSQVIIRPYFLTFPIVKSFLFLENIIEKITIGPLKKLSWNIIIYAKF